MYRLSHCIKHFAYKITFDTYKIPQWHQGVQSSGRRSTQKWLPTHPFLLLKAFADCLCVHVGGAHWGQRWISSLCRSHGPPYFWCGVSCWPWIFQLEWLAREPQAATCGLQTCAWPWCRNWDLTLGLLFAWQARYWLSHPCSPHLLISKW